MSTQAKRRPRYVTVEVTTDADIDLAQVLDGLDEGELADYGLHEAGKCSGSPLPAETPDEGAVREAITALHRQAHPAEHPEPFLCHEEPCRSLPFRQLMPKVSSR